MNDPSLPVAGNLSATGAAPPEPDVAGVAAHAGRAAIAAVLVPLGLWAAATPADAGLPPGPWIDPVTPAYIGNGIYEYSFTVNNGAEGDSITEITIPELNSGDLFTDTPLPDGWSWSEVPALVGGPTFKDDSTAQYDILITGGSIALFASETFDFYSYFGTTVAANILLSQSGTPVTIDPNVPDSNVPEPASLSLLGAGALMLVGARARKKKT